MDKYIVRVFDRDMNVINCHIFTCWYQEEAEANGRQACKWLRGHTWDVRLLNR